MTKINHIGQPIWCRRILRRRCVLCNSRTHWTDECSIPDPDFYSGYAYALIDTDTELKEALRDNRSPSLDPTTDLDPNLVQRYEEILQQAAEARDRRIQNRKSRGT